MTLKRWIPTFAAFPVGGYLAYLIVGSLEGPLSGAAGGLIAGAVIGAAQWLALRPRGYAWIARTAVAMAAGTALAAALTGAGTDVADLMLMGAIAGAAVGAAQAGSAVWTAITAGSWALGWLATAAVIGVNADEGFVVFGSAGAILVTLVTGLALRDTRVHV
jgi:hypothetical protein